MMVLKIRRDQKTENIILLPSSVPEVIWSVPFYHILREIKALNSLFLNPIASCPNQPIRVQILFQLVQVSWLSISNADKLRAQATTRSQDLPDSDLLYNWMIFVYV